MSRKMKGVSDIKTLRTSRLRCKPKMPDQEYLDVYLLEKKKEMLKQYKKATDKANLKIEDNMDEVNAEIKKVKGGIAEKIQASQSEKETERKETKNKPQVNNSKLKTQMWDY